MKLYTEREIAFMSLGERKALIADYRKVVDSLGLTKLKEADLYKKENSAFLDDPKTIRTFTSLVYQSFISFNHQINI